MFNSTLVILILPLMIITLGAGLLLGYLLLSIELGRNAAWEMLRKNLPIILIAFLAAIMAALGLTHMILRESDDLVFVIFSSLFIAVLCGGIVTQPWRKKRGGEVLLDTQRPKSIALTLFGMLYLLLGLVFVWLLVRDSSDIIDFVLCIGFFSSALGCLPEGLTSLKVTEKGLLSFSSLVRWEKIASYEWSSDKTCVLTLQVTSQIPLLRISRTGPSKWRIPAKHKDTLDGLLAQYVPQVSETGD